MLKEKYEDDPLPIQISIWICGWRQDRLLHPIEIGLYGLSNITIKDLRTTHNVSTIRCSQLVLSTQTPEFDVILD